MDVKYMCMIQIGYQIISNYSVVTVHVYVKRVIRIFPSLFESSTRAVQGELVLKSGDREPDSHVS